MGNEHFTKHVITTAADGACSVFAADMDGDGDVDVLSASSEDNRVALYRNLGAQTFVTRDLCTYAEGARSVYAADLDNDGDLDVLSASADNSTGSLLQEQWSGKVHAACRQFQGLGRLLRVCCGLGRRRRPGCAFRGRQ